MTSYLRVSICHWCWKLHQRGLVWAAGVVICTPAPLWLQPRTEKGALLSSLAQSHTETLSLVANTQTRQTRRRLCKSAAHAKGIFAPHAVGCWIPAGVSCCEIKLNHLASSLLLGEVQLSRSAPVAEPIKWLDSCQCPRALLAAYILSPPVFGFFSLPLWQALMNLRD
jgi:hypothetical protein